MKSAKYLIKKSQAAMEDPMIGLLNLWNTPQEGLTTSPVQRLFGRRTKTLIPCANSVLTPAAAQIMHSERVRMEDMKAAVAERYIDRRELPPLQVGDTVHMQPITRDKKEWQEAYIRRLLLSAHLLLPALWDIKAWHSNSTASSPSSSFHVNDWVSHADKLITVGKLFYQIP